MSEQHKPKSWKDLTSEKYFRSTMSEPIKEFTEQDMIEFSMECAHSRYTEETLRSKLNGFQMQKLESKQQKQYPSGIISFKTQDGSLSILDFALWNKYSTGYDGWVKQSLDSGHKIWSIQNRNEILTVGDNTRCGKVKDFYIEDNYICATLSAENSPVEAKYRLPEESLKKLQPLFQIDGKDIYEGDEYWYVITSPTDLANYLPIKATGFRDTIHITKNREYFLTNSEANTWVTENKPSFSLKQAREIWNEARAATKIGTNWHNSFDDYLKTITP